MTEEDLPKPAHPRWSLRKLLVLAFAAGLLLFFLVWLSSRHDYDFYTATDAGDAADQSDTLPAPIAPDVASGSGASGLSVDPAAAVTPAPANAVPGIIEAPPASPAPPPATASTSAGSLANDRASPIPLATPAPRYPQEALRRDVDGTVRVRISVASDGSVTNTAIESSSGDRSLDRAALDAARRWSFQPATRGGQPIAADVVVPIIFQR